MAGEDLQQGHAFRILGETLKPLGNHVISFQLFDCKYTNEEISNSEIGLTPGNLKSI
jgi:hypothetical protein